MPTISDNVYDAGFVPLGPGIRARAHFRIAAAAAGAAGGIHTTKDVVAPATETGLFAAELPALATYPKPVPVWVGFSWFDALGEGSGVGAPQVSWLPYPIYVPPEGGVLTDLIGKQLGNDLVFHAPAVDTSESTGYQLINGRYLYVRKDLL